MRRKVKYKAIILIIIVVLIIPFILIGCSVKDSKYYIKIENLDNGQIVADKIEAEPDDIVTLTINPDVGYRLDENIIYINGLIVELDENTFIMPAKDVVITAYFTNGTEDLLYIYDESDDTYMVDGIVEDSSVSEIIIPSVYRGRSIARIKQGAFFLCENLISVTIADSVKEIGSWAFMYCRNLVSVKLPKGLKDISSSLFEDCLSLKSINIPSSVQSIGERAFSRCKFESIIFPKGITHIYARAFIDCSNIITIEIPKEVVFIGQSAFERCSRLNALYFMGSITSSNPEIARDAFFNCTKLTSVYAMDNESIVNVKAIFDLFPFFYPNILYYYL